MQFLKWKMRTLNETKKILVKYINKTETKEKLFKLLKDSLCFVYVNCEGKVDLEKLQANREQEAYDNQNF